MNEMVFVSKRVIIHEIVIALTTDVRKNVRIRKIYEIRDEIAENLRSR